MKTSFKKSPLAVAIATLCAVLACEPLRADGLVVDNGQMGSYGNSYDSAKGSAVRITNNGLLEAEDLIIKAYGTGSTDYGVFIDKNGRLIGSNLNITTVSATGLRIGTGGSAALTNSHIENGIQVGDAGSTLDIRESTVSRGINAVSEGSAVVDKVAVEAGGNGAGFSVANGSQITASNSTVGAYGTNSIGISAQGATSGGLNSTVNADHVAIDVDSLNDGTRFGSHGVYTRNGGVVQLSNSTVATRSANTNGFTASGNTAAAATPSTISATNVSIETSGAGSNGLGIDSGAIINLTNSQVVAKGSDAHALLASGKSLMGVSSSALNTVSLTDSDVQADQASVVRADGAKLDLRVNSSHLHSATGMLLEADNGSTVTLRSEGNSALVGDIRADGSSVVDLLMSKGALTGAVTHGGTFALSDGAAWNVTGDSDVQSLDLQSAGVHFVPGAAFKTLTINGDLSGSGQFFMNTDLAARAGDLLLITGQTSGQHELVVADTGHEPGASGQQLMLVDAAGGAGQFNLYGEHVDAGAFRYTLEQQGEDWYLRNTAQVPAAPGGNLANQPESLSTGANAAVANVAATATLWSAEMNALNKRLGELRMGDDEGGLWVRGINKRYEFGEHSSRAFDQDVSGMEIGADGAVAVNGGKVFIGGMVGMAQSDNDFGEGASGKTDSKLLGAYATFLHDSGWYVDGVVKYNRFDNEIKSTSNMGQQVKSNYDADGIGADVEVGKHIKLQDGWFVEPQLEVTATHTTSDAYQASNGLRVKPGDVDSLQSRVGTLMGHNLKLSTGQEVQPYAKVSYVTEHGNDSEVNVNGHRLDSAMPGSRTEVGGGVVLQVSAKQKVYLDVEHASGDDFEEPWAVNLGYRYLW